MTNDNLELALDHTSYFPNLTNLTLKFTVCNLLHIICSTPSYDDKACTHHGADRVRIMVWMYSSYFSNYSFRKNSNFFKKNLKNSFKNFSFFFRKIINKIFISVRLFFLELSYLRYFYVIRRKKNKKYLFFLSKLDTFLKKLKLKLGL